jgi:RNA polymerase sigma-32 factor
MSLNQSDASAPNPGFVPSLPINDFSFLNSCEEEFELVKKWREKGDTRAVNRLITSHKRLVEKIAYGYSGYGLCMEELIAEGYVGMMQAVEKFDTEKGFRLSTYASWWIKAAIQEYIFNSWSLVKFSTTKTTKKLFFGLRKYKNSQGYDDYLTPDQAKDIATHLDVPLKDVYEMNQRLKGGDHSLNAPMGSEEDANQWQDWIPDDKQNLEEKLAQSDEEHKIQKKVHAALEILDPREQHILIQRRFKEPPTTLDMLSEELKISKERVRQIENKAYDKIHDELKKTVNPKQFFKTD